MRNNKSVLKVIKTKDGSYTIFNEDLEESYHSIHGAIQESSHVFIKNGLCLLTTKSCHILEVGFGTGLNATLTLNHTIHHPIKIQYTAIEPFPVDLEIIKSMCGGLSEAFAANFLDLNRLKWEKQHDITDSFSLIKQCCSIQTMPINTPFDLVYFDAFSPSKQPEMWTKDIFKKLFDHMKTNGLLTTYCAQGQMKRNLKEAGFLLKSLPGPAGKREMTLAIKP